MCGVSTQQWPSTEITWFERTRQSARLDAVTIPLTRSEWILAYLNTSFWGISATKTIAKKPRKSTTRRADVTFSKFRGSRRKKKNPTIYFNDKKEDSVLWFVKNELQTISIGQTTHNQSPKSGLRRSLFDNSCLCCSVLQCVAVYCSVLQCVAVCCSVLQCVVVCCSVIYMCAHSMCIW